MRGALLGDFFLLIQDIPMNRFTRLSIIAAASCLCGLIFLCSKHQNNNPVTSSYEGNYVLEVNWDSLQAPNTLEMLKTYIVSCSTGVDKFDSITPGDSLKALFDVSVAYGTNDPQKATLAVKFKKEFSGMVYLTGVRPNGKKVLDSAKIIVKNPYKPSLKNLPASLTLGRGTNLISIDIEDSSGGVNNLFLKLKQAQIIDTIQALPKGTNHIAIVVPDNLFSDSLIIWATNNNFTSDTTRIAISIQGYTPAFDSIALPKTFHCGDTLKCPVFLSNAAASQFKVIATKEKRSQADSSSYADTSVYFSYAKRVDIKMSKPLIDTGKVVLKTYLLDSAGIKSEIQTDTFFVLYKLPSLQFSVSKDSIFVSNKDSIDMQVSDTNSCASKYTWKISKPGFDTVFTTEINHIKILPDSSVMTIRVFGINIFGFRGDTATQKLIPKNFQYTLTKVTGEFPDVITARHQATWKVTLDSTAKLAKRNGSYYWKIFEGSKITNVSGPTLTAWSGTFNDSVPLQIKVIARDAVGDSSSELSSFVTIRQYKPVFRMSKDTIATPILTPVVISAHTFDVNPDKSGKIDTVFWDKNNDGKADTTTADSSIILSFPYAGFYKISGWAKDNDGFLSETSFTVVNVKADYPYFISKADTTVYVDVANQFTVSAMPGASGAAISKYYWRVLEDNKYDTTTAPLFSYKFTKPGIFTVTAVCMDTRGAQSAKPDTFLVTVDPGLPKILSAVIDTAESRLFVNEAIDLKISAMDPNGTVKMIFVNWDSTQSANIDSFVVDNTSKLDSLISPVHVYPLSTSGPRIIAVWATDNDGYKSQVFSKHVTIRRGTPVTTAFSWNLATVYVNDHAQYSLTANDTNGTIQQWFISWNTGEAFKSYALPLGFIDTVFTQSGTRVVSAYAVDNDGLASDTVKATLTVATTAPVVSAITSITPENALYISSSNKFIVSASTPHGTIKKVYINWNGGTVANDSNVTKTGASVLDTFAHTYTISDTGAKTINVWAYNDMGTKSAVVSKVLNIHLGKPVITGITCDTLASKMFINDSMTFAISYSDPNGTVDSISVDNGTGSYNAFIKAPAGAYAFKRIFARSDTGAKTIRAITKDNDGLLSDTSVLQIKIRRGAPAIDSIHVPQTIWINDTNTYQISARDTNGTIIRYYYDWTNTGAWQDSSLNGSALGHFSSSGVKTIRYGAMDNDSLLTITTKQVTVHLGIPRIWNPGGETLFVVTPAVGGNINIPISSYDTNGTLKNYFWKFNAPFDTSSATQTGTDSIYRNYNIVAPLVNSGFQMAVFGKDDDGNVSGDTMWLYPDAPPPAPVINAVTASDSITIYFKNKDAKDGNATQYQILVHDGSEPDSTLPADIQSNWKSGYRVSDDSFYDYMFKFKLPANTPKHGYYYQVHARDARGSVTSSTIGHTFSY